MHHAILYISLLLLPPPPLQHETSLFHTLALWSRWTQHKSCLFHLLHLDTVLSDSTLENFANMSDSLFKWRFRFVFIQKFCYNGNMTWRLLLSISPLVPRVINITFLLTKPMHNLKKSLWEKVKWSPKEKGCNSVRKCMEISLEKGLSIGNSMICSDIIFGMNTTSDFSKLL